jgi:hypothetical protein
MKRYWIFVIAIVFALPPVPAAAQIEFEFSGYVVDLPMYQRMNQSLVTLLEAGSGSTGRYESDLVVNLTRLRLRPSLRLWEGATIALEHEVDLLFSTTDMAFRPSAERTNRQAVTLRWQPVDEDNLTMQHYVDRLYFRQNLEWGSVIAGRQRIQWGTGRIWNPTDLFNPINPASFDKIEKDGADAVSAKVYLGSMTDVQAVVNFRAARMQKDGADPAPDSTNVGLRFRTNYREFDISAMGGWFDRRVVFGGDFAGNFMEAGVRGEAILVLESDELPNEDYIRLSLGADYQFTPEFYGLVEYLYNGEGRNDPAIYQVVRLYQGDILQLNQKYLYTGGTYLVHPLVTASAGLLQNLGDGSGFATLLATWSSSDNSLLSAGLMMPYGGEFDEYWYYPTAVYLKGEYHF